MPNKEFLETYLLYRKLKIDAIPQALHQFQKVNINMPCLVCDSNQTYVMKNDYLDPVESFGRALMPSNGAVVKLHYMCCQCNEFERFFFIKIGGGANSEWLMKIGQFPAWEVTGTPNLEKILGNHAGYFKKGQICESQGYGIGAFGYYRRIVEEVIDELLDEISGLLTGDELSSYKIALEKTKKTIVTAEKIELVKDLLPIILRPDGMNPLSALHSVLSQGLHAESDEECLELSQHCREILVFLVNQISASKEAAKSFTSTMRKLLDKKSDKNN
jgi:hypothetical protein